MVALIALLACQPAPTGLARCDAIRGATEREECRYAEILKLGTGPELTAALAGYDAPTRDLLLIRVAMNQPDRSAVLCAQVTTEFGKQRCDQIQGRPHLRGGP